MPSYSDHADFNRLTVEFPYGPRFPQLLGSVSQEHFQEQRRMRLERVLARASATNFYQRLWGDRAPSAESLSELPVYDKNDLTYDLALHPPFGSIAAIDTYDSDPPVPVVQTTSGTTGVPQPILFGPRGREAANLLLARLYHWLGVGRGDVLHSVYGHGLTNGGHYAREAAIHFLDSVFISAGTGVETSSARQLEVMRTYRSTVLLGFGDYLRHLGELAQATAPQGTHGLDVRMIIGHIPPGMRNAVEAAWGGVPAFDWYGVADTGIIAAEGPERNGLWVWEDAHIVEILDESGRPITQPGVEGDLVVTCLFKDDIAPVVRFNTHDRTAWCPEGAGGILPFRRITGFQGRSDNMVKLKGINVFPEALSNVLRTIDGFDGEYLLRVYADDSGSERAEVLIEDGDTGTVRADRYAEALKNGVGLRLPVRLVGPGTLDDLTEVRIRQKPRRLLDER